MALRQTLLSFLLVSLSAPSVFAAAKVVDGIYKVKKDITLAATKVVGMDDVEAEDFDDIKIDYPAGEKIVIQQVRDKKLGLLYKLKALPVTGEDQYPTEILLTSEQLKGAELELISERLFRSAAQ